MQWPLEQFPFARFHLPSHRVDAHLEGGVIVRGTPFPYARHCLCSRTRRSTFNDLRTFSLQNSAVPLPVTHGYRSGSAMMYPFKTYTQCHGFDGFSQAPRSSNVTITSNHQPPPHNHRHENTPGTQEHEPQNTMTQQWGGGRGREGRGWGWAVMPIPIKGMFSFKYIAT